MARHDPREARLLGLWTAGWLAVLLAAGLVWLGDPALQWPVLLVPAGWALLALRPRRGRAVPDDVHDEPPPRPRTDTVERPAIRPRPEWPDRR